MQNCKLRFSVEILLDLVQIQVRETVSGVFLARMDISIQVWHVLLVMRRDFNETHITPVPITENQLREMQMMEVVVEQVEMNYPEKPCSSYFPQPVNDFHFPWEETGSAENSISIDEDEGFSETMKYPAPQQPLQLVNFCVLLRTFRNFLLFDSSFNAFLMNVVVNH